MFILTCPICGGSLALEGKSFYCPKRHCFDKAKSGYINLLPVNKTHSKAPGDNKLMVNGRSAFLNKGYYHGLREALCQAVVSAAQDFVTDGNPKAAEPSGNAEKYKGKLALLDAGCGEGYYTAGLAEALEAAGVSSRIYGVDISKTAVDAAAKRTGKAVFAVGSVFGLPVADCSCGIVTEVFAPFCREEFHRVLCPNGRIILVIPARDHLLELKQAVYEMPYENEVKPYAIEGFALLSKTEVRDRICLPNSEDIQNLFTMTPYYYKTSRQDTERLLALDSLETTISFEILSYRKESAASSRSC